MHKLRFLARMAIGLPQVFQSKRLRKIRALPLHGRGINLHGHTCKNMKLPHSRVLKLLSRYLFLAMIIVMTPFLRTFLGASSLSVPTILEPEVGSNPIDLNELSILLRDLSNEGLFKTGGRVMLVGNGGEQYDNLVHDSQVLDKKNTDLISVTDLDRQNSIPDESFDFAFTSGFHPFIDRGLKVGGIAAVQLSDNPSFAFNKPSNYKIVYLRRLQSTVLAMRKTGYTDSIPKTQRRLLEYHTEARKQALRKLEDVLLEPPRAASRKSRTYLKRTRYLPDLMGDSLEGYPRRVFIDVGLPEKEGGSGTGWFAKHYPTRNLHFEMYKIETVTEESSGKEVPQVEEVGMSDWLRNNVREEEYVVMKAEAEVVEEMVKSKAIRLVDELFLECKPQGRGVKGSKRAYWECLALYGKLRDEGVAVHQWWG